MKYFEIFWNGYYGYFNYLVGEIAHPTWSNYFYFLIGISLLIWMLELLFPWRKEQKAFRKDFWLDAFYMFFNFFLFSLIAYNAISNVFVELFNDFLGLFGIENLVAIEVQNLPLFTQFLIMFVARDFIQWNVHRLLHYSDWMWQFHKVHHSVEEMGFAAHLRFHWMETVIYRFFEYLPLAMIGFGINDFFILHIITLTIGHFNHSNLYLPIGPLKYIFNTPQMHLWHHSYELPEDAKYGMNFGISLSLWDYLFKTAKIPYQNPYLKLGFRGMKKFPHTFLKQETYPWSNKKKAE